MLDQLRAGDDRGHRRMGLQVLEHLVDRTRRIVRNRLDARHDADRDGLLVRVDDAATEQSVRRIAREQPCGAFARRALEPRVDLFLGKLVDLLHADGHVLGRGTLVADGFLGEQRVHAVA